MEYRSFSVTVRKSNGTITRKQIDAVDALAAKAESSIYGKFIRATPIKLGWFGKWRLKRRRKQGFLGSGISGVIRRMMKKDVRLQLDFLQTMSNMLVGYNVSDALSIMIQNFSGVMRDASQRMRHYIVIDQLNPEDALEKLGPKYLPRVTIAIIRSNAKVVALHEAFREGMEFHREIVKIQKSQATEMTMAMFGFLISMTFVISCWLFGFELLDDVGYFNLMPDTGKGADSLADVKEWMGWAGIGASIVMTVWVSVILIFGVGRDLFPRKVEKWILHIPMLRESMLNRRSFISTYQMEKLLSKGVPLMQTFTHIAEELEDGVLKEDIERVLSLLERGDPEWVDGFYSFSDLDRALLKSSTHQDEMASVFKAQANQFLTSYEQSMVNLKILHKIVSGMFMAVIVLIMALLMFLPMVGGFDLVDQL
jgi:general secretion pathway protein F